MVNTFTDLGLHLELKSETEPISALYLEFRSMVFHRAFILVSGLMLDKYI